MSDSVITIALAWAVDNIPREVAVVVPAGTTLASMRASLEMLKLVPQEIVDSAAAIGVWSKVRQPSYVLRDQDRIEIYARLKADPKEQRRKRAR
jgi:putative ubiquitin-RnfH superfamily antitoxin RatB of RatAB toxin-antitoxin module